MGRLSPASGLRKEVGWGGVGGGQVHNTHIHVLLQQEGQIYLYHPSLHCGPSLKLFKINTLSSTV